jgi:uncharacterized protein YbcV (DUF1398 family)
MLPSQSTAIRSTWKKVHSPTGLPFPSTVADLQSIGVTRYRVDYVASNIIAYIGSSADFAPMPDEHDRSEGSFKPGTVTWDAEKLIQAIRKTQAGEGNYWDFSRNAIEAGVTDYTTYIKGKKVVYNGKDGESHTEWFPGPKQD